MTNYDKTLEKMADVENGKLTTVKAQEVYIQLSAMIETTNKQLAEEEQQVSESIIVEAMGGESCTDNLGLIKELKRKLETLNGLRDRAADIVTDLQKVDRHNERKELITEYSERCDTLLKQSKVVVELATKLANEIDRFNAIEARAHRMSFNIGCRTASGRIPLDQVISMAVGNELYASKTIKEPAAPRSHVFGWHGKDSLAITEDAISNYFAERESEMKRMLSNDIGDFVSTYKQVL